MRVLGPVGLTGPSGMVELSAELRTLLGVLALGAPDPVGGAQLAAALGIDAAAAARHLAELRQALAAAGLPAAVEVTGAGCRLAVPCDAFDFARDVREAAKRLAARDRPGGIALLESALGRWPAGLDSEPLAGSPVREWAAAKVARLREMRLVAIEDRWEAELRLAAAAVHAAGAPVADPVTVAVERSAAGSAAQAVAELAEAVRVHPLRERLWELLLVADFLAGRRADALEAYDRAASVLAEQVGVAPGERLRAVAAAVRAGDVGDGLAPFGSTGDKPPARALPEPAVHAPLPVPLAPLIGRDELVIEVAGRLAVRRLITLTGPGGCGKTRLAIAVARRQAGDRAWFVDLSAVESPLRVPAAVAAVLGVRDDPARDPLDGIVERIGDADRLLVLDNCEQVLAGCAELVHRLLRARPALRVLATSRSALRVSGEVPIAVPPLPVPAPGTAVYTVADLARVPAARLFLDRAAARMGRPIPEREAPAVAQLCAELDGMPLALELAAARTPVLTVPELLTRLRADLGVLRSPDPLAPARHRTLTATVESSVGQLEPEAQRLFRRLSVFAGGFDAEAAQAVHDTGGRLLPVLVAASLVEPAGDDGPPDRFRMLSTVRRCAQTMLEEAGDDVAARRAHAAYCIALAEQADEQLYGPEQDRWLATLRAEWANVRAALSWLAEAGAAGIPHGDLRLAAAVATYCHLRGHYADGRAWLSAALARHPGAPAALRAKAATGAAMLAMLLCDYPAAEEHARAGRDAYRCAADRRGTARVELILGSVARERARYAEAASHCDVAAALYADCGDERGETRAVQLRGFAAWLAGDFDRAEPRLHACLRRFEALGDAEAAAAALVHLGAVALYRGDTDRATALLDAGLERYAALGFPEGVAWAHNLRGLVDLRGARLDRAAAHLTRSLVVHQAVGDRWRTASVLEALAEVALSQGAPKRAAGLLSQADGIRAEIGAPVPACERPAVAGLRAALSAVLPVDHAQAVPA